MFTQLDRNGDGMLQGDEAGVFRNQMEQIDTDKNGVISQNELTTAYTSGAIGGRGRGRSRGGNTNDQNSTGERGGGRGRGNRGARADADQNRENNEGDESEANNNRGNRNANARNRGGNQAPERPVEMAKTFESLTKETYRLKATKDLKQTGLPSWFTSRDANKDGQVSMSEYAARMTERLATEFIGRDLNGDGLITADEAAGSR
jgi:hypothetical protein